MNWNFKLVAGPFGFTEGPVWTGETVLFTDIPNNRIMNYNPTSNQTEVFRDNTNEANGLMFDSNGQLYACEGGGRRIACYNDDGTSTTIVDNFQQKRLNSPNDATYGSDGSLYFTDPPYGLDGLEESPLRELEFNGVYRLRPNGDLELLVRDQTRPNGIALSPDESTLYVANSDPGPNHVWMAYDLSDNGVSNGRVFYDISDQDEPGAADGMKVDRAGHLFATGPGGVWIIAPDGTHLGTIVTPEVTANVGWGDDGRTLYMTSSTGLYRIGLSTDGVIPGP